MRPSRACTSIVVATLASALCLPAPGRTSVVHGSLEEKEGQRILRVWGSHEEMGYAHGYLLAEEIVEILDNYIIGVRWEPWSYEHTIRPYVEEYFVLPAEYEEELEGMLDGIQEAAVSIYLESVEREMDSLDLHTANLWGDFTSYQCSSTSAWGEMTEDDALLAGGPAMVRNFEYATGPDWMLATQSLLIAYGSSDSDERKWVSVAWPGFIGCLSGMSEDGIVAATNAGGHIAPAAPSPHTLVGIFFTIRDAVENMDENGDEEHTIDDAVFAIDQCPRLGGLLTHLVSPFELGQAEEPAAVVEMDFYGYAVRYGTDNLDHPRYIYSNDCMIVTNHDRVYMEPPEAGSAVRYTAVAESLNIDLRVDSDELWRLGQLISYPSTLHAMLFRPGLLDLYVAYADSGVGAYGCPRVHWEEDELFGDFGGVSVREGPYVEAHPNPFWDGTRLVISQEIEFTSLAIYNCLGQRVFQATPSAGGRVDWYGQDGSGRALPAGVYFCRLVSPHATRPAKIVLVR